MTKVIKNIELLKKLQPYLKNMETKYFFNKFGVTHTLETEGLFHESIDYKTLTLEEAIELINKVKKEDLERYFEKYNIKRTDVLFYVLGGGIELILQHLIDNNLLKDETNN